LNGDSGNPFSKYLNDHCTVQITGTFGVGGNVAIEGSLDGSTFAVLNDPDGSPLNFTAAGINEVRENVNLLRPIVTAGDGSTNLVVTMVISDIGGKGR
jgi:hypothetical protein